MSSRAVSSRNEQDFGIESGRPIFVLGMPRSGTSLAEQILASHPDVFGAGEWNFMAKASSEVSSLTPDNAPLHRAALKLGREAASITALRYLRRLDGLDRAHPRIVDKMPHNFLCIGLIGLILPQAKIVHCEREPIDTCLSIFMQYFSQDHLYAATCAQKPGPLLSALRKSDAALARAFAYPNS